MYTYLRLSLQNAMKTTSSRVVRVCASAWNTDVMACQTVPTETMKIGSCVVSSIRAIHVISCVSVRFTLRLCFPACPDDYFKCTNNAHCIPQNYTCDGYGDCEDFSDEILEDCRKPPSPEYLPWKHHTSQKLLLHHLHWYPFSLIPASLWDGCALWYGILPRRSTDDVQRFSRLSGRQRRGGRLW